MHEPKCFDEGQGNNAGACSPRPHRSRRRSSIAAGPPLEATPEYLAIERSSAYGDFANLERTTRRRNSMTHVSTVDMETRFRQTFASMMEYQGQSISIQKLKAKFERRGSLISSERNSNRSSVIGSIVDTNTMKSGDEDLSHDITGKESVSMPLTEVRQPVQREKKKRLEREQLIESLILFSCHTPCAVLEDLIKHELRLWEEHYDAEETAADLADDTHSHGSLSTLSSDEKSINYCSDFDKSQKSWSQKIECVASASFEQKMLLSRPSLPRSRKRQCALLFVDITGFTKLSTMLDVESLSKVINSYFEMIIDEVQRAGGDILKFAGDAFFAEWRVEDDEDSIRGPEDLKQLNASISSSQEICSISPTNGWPAASMCVWKAAKCATAIVNKFSDFQVPVTSDTSFTSENSGPNEAMLNVHCGVGTGELVGLHVGDYREDDGEEEAHDDNGVELRREFLFLGDVIDQVQLHWSLVVDSEELVCLIAHSPGFKSSPHCLGR
jgi:class 3 adenylate cyclase